MGDNGERRQRFRRWRLNAPEGFRWTDDDVIHQQNNAFLNGCIAGWIGAAVVMLILVAIL